MLNAKLRPALAAAIVLSSAGAALAASDTNTAGSDPVNPVVDEVVLFETIETMPVNLASNIIGNKVYSIDDKEIGKVSDILLDDNNQMIALKVGVGGFLGLDEKYIAVPMGDITFSSPDFNLHIATDLAEQDIRDATGS